ncbi:MULTISPECIES: hypothetical protein [Spongiactinospora]|nr:hypothetical protein [Spongiactinospora gelatinilytica]
MPPAHTSPVTDLVRACHRFTTHMRLLADQLGRVPVDDGDVTLLDEATQSARIALWHVIARSNGALQRPTEGNECSFFTVITDAEWQRLMESGELPREHAYECGMSADHPGPHVTFIYEAMGTFQGWWLRWRGRERELVIHPYCGEVQRGLDPDGLDDTNCLLFQGHPCPHRF